MILQIKCMVTDNWQIHTERQSGVNEVNKTIINIYIWCVTQITAIFTIDANETTNLSVDWKSTRKPFFWSMEQSTCFNFQKFQKYHFDALVVDEFLFPDVVN